jgi:hypothetical protein
MLRPYEMNLGCTRTGDETHVLARIPHPASCILHPAAYLLVTFIFGKASRILSTAVCKFSSDVA